MSLVFTFRNSVHFIGAVRSLVLTLLVSFFTLQNSLSAAPCILPANIGEDLVNLTNAVNTLAEGVMRGNVDTETYAPVLIAIGTNISESMRDFYSLAQYYNSSDYEMKMAKVYAALQELQVFTTSLSDNRTQIAAAAVGVIAAGVVTGLLAKKYMFTCDKSKNILFKAYSTSKKFCLSCYRCCKLKRNGEESFLREEDHPERFRYNVSAGGEEQAVLERA